MFSDYQAALALLGTAMLVVDARAKTDHGVPAPSPLSPRWVLAWVLAHGAVTPAIEDPIRNMAVIDALQRSADSGRVEAV